MFQGRKEETSVSGPSVGARHSPFWSSTSASYGTPHATCSPNDTRMTATSCSYAPVAQPWAPRGRCPAKTSRTLSLRAPFPSLAQASTHVRHHALASDCFLFPHHMFTSPSFPRPLDLRSFLDPTSPPPSPYFLPRPDVPPPSPRRQPRDPLSRPGSPARRPTAATCPPYLAPWRRTSTRASPSRSSSPSRTTLRPKWSTRCARRLITCLAPYPLSSST